mgnify:FL=1
MNNPNVKFISKEKLLNSPEIYHKVNSSKTADEGCNNKWKQSLFQLFFVITKKDNDNLSFLQPLENSAINAHHIFVTFLS